jgi:hypothetical protein
MGQRFTVSTSLDQTILDPFMPSETGAGPTAHSEAEQALDALAVQFIAARAVIDKSGTPMMRRLIDLLLFEIAVALADPEEDPARALDPVV